MTYHSVVAVRYPDLCRLINDMWELGSFASGGLPDKPPGFQFVLWDRRPDGSVGMALVLPALTDCRWLVRIPAGPLGSLKCDPPKGNGRRPQKIQFVLWDTNARINGLVATDLETLVSQVLSPFPTNAGVRRWALRDDHCHRSQEQPQPFSAQKRLCPHAPRRNNSQLSRRNSTGSNRSPAEY